MTNPLYKTQLLEHSRNPRNKGDIADADLTCEGFHANCGDKLTIGLFLEDDKITKVRYQIRACAVCTASASIMSDWIIGKTLADVEQQGTVLDGFLKNETDIREPFNLFEGFVDSVNRHNCILLPWQAIAQR